MSFKRIESTTYILQGRRGYLELDGKNKMVQGHFEGMDPKTLPVFFTGPQSLRAFAQAILDTIPERKPKKPTP